MSDTKKTILQSASRFLSGTMLSRVSGLARDVTLAYAFGTQSAVAALLVAFRFAHLLRRLLGEGAMQSAFIPHFEELRKTSPERAGKFFCDLSFTLIVVLSALIIFVMTSLAGLLHLDVLSPGNTEIAWLTLLMMPSLLFICLFGINASLMQCEKRYFVSSSAPVLFNLVWIIGILSTQHLSSGSAMSWLSLFVILACTAQWLVTLPRTVSILRGYGLTNLLRKFKWNSPDVWGLVKPLSLGIIGIAASQINNALDAVFARWANDEGPAILWFAIRIQQLPLALFGIALSGALLPPLARAIKGGNAQQFIHFLNFAFNITLALMIPLSIALFMMGDRCISIIYGHGDFTNNSIVETTKALWGYTLGLVPMALILVLSPAYYAQKDYKTPSMAGVASMIINVGLNTIFVTLTEMGVTGIAIATSISAWINFLWLEIRLPTILPIDHFWRSSAWLIDAGKITAITGLAAFVIFGIDMKLWGDFTPLMILNGMTPEFLMSFHDRFIQLGFNGIVFIGILITIFRKKLRFN